MTERSSQSRAVPDPIAVLGVGEVAALYLDRCQVDTPDHLVKRVWALISTARARVGQVVDFGCGDGRFAKYGKYRSYIGYEIDRSRCSQAVLPGSARIVNACAFSESVTDADLAIGNPPYVRNQDLPGGWRQQVADAIRQRIGVAVSGLANAWQYFFLLSLASTKEDGLVAIVIPFEWVSRPSASALRSFIRQNEWQVSVYRLHDETFDRVLTTSCITIVDKRVKNGEWRYFDEDADHSFKRISSSSGGSEGPLPYVRGRPRGIIAKRGLSPGTQKVLVLTDSERVRLGLKADMDVVRCVTSLRHVPSTVLELDDAAFSEYFQKSGVRCWLIRTDKKPSKALQLYLDSVSDQDRDTATCRQREVWWKFNMPQQADLLLSSGFRSRPKVMRNLVGAVAVGGVCGIYGVPKSKQRRLLHALVDQSYEGKVVAHANGLQKLEPNQINALLLNLVKTQ